MKRKRKIHCFGVWVEGGVGFERWVVLKEVNLRDGRF